MNNFKKINSHKGSNELDESELIKEIDGPEIQNNLSIKSKEYFSFGNIQVASNTKSMNELMALVIEFLNQKPVKKIISNTNLEKELNDLRKSSTSFYD